MALTRAVDTPTSDSAELARRPTERSARASVVSIAVALGLVYVLWGSTYFAIRLAIDTMPPFLMASTRFLVAGALLYGWSAVRAESGTRRPSARTWLAAFIVGSALLAVGNGGVSWAEQYVATGTAALMIATTPIWMAVLRRVFWREGLDRLTVVGILIGMVGLALLVWPGGGGRFSFVGFAVLFVAAVSWAAGSLYARKAPHPAAPGMGTGMEMLAGGAVLLVVSVASGELTRVHLHSLSVTSLLALAYLIVFGSLVAYTCYTWLLRRVDVALVSTYAYVNPVVAVLLGTLFLGEPLTPRTIIAAAIIVVGVAAIVSRTRTTSTAKN